MNRACVFVHYDKDNIVDEYVYYYLQSLKEVCSKIIFVTVSNIKVCDIKKLEKLNIQVVVRDNVGYDFYSYKVGLNYLDLNNFDELILCNDSAFGPLFSLCDIFKYMKDKKCDFWGITECELIKYHIQSYFLVFKKEIIDSKVFQDFWNELKIIEDKDILIKEYEVGISQLLIKNDFIAKSYINNNVSLQDLYKSYIRAIKYKRFKRLRILKMILTFRFIYKKYKRRYNIPIGLWDSIIIEQKMPFIKKSLFTTDELKNSHIVRFNNLKNYFLHYPIFLITNYIKRFDNE